jgi:ABC-2 type transport system permease protein
MPRTIRLALREYLAAVKTKGFIISLVLVPILMSGSIIAMVLLKDQVDTTDRELVILDHSGVVGESLIAAAEKRNETEVWDPEDESKKLRPTYLFELVEPDLTDPQGQRLALSDQVRQGELSGFLEIGPEALHPGDDKELSRIAYHAENAVLDDLRDWLGWPVNSQLRRTRLTELGVDPDQAEGAFTWLSIDAMGLTSLDRSSGEVQQAEKSNEGIALGIPLALVMMMFMMIMMGAVPLLNSVMEEKTQRIAEVLLGSISPFGFMMGKVLAGVALSLTGMIVYALGGFGVAWFRGAADVFPMEMMPWFFSFMVLAILMIGSSMAALGSACNDPKEAQSLTLPAMLPVMIPMFVLMPVLKEPTSTFATVLSLFPPCTPMVMLLRISTPYGVPAWQPWVGLAGMVLFTILSIWVGGRIFRVGILMQGKPPKLADMLRWAIRG